jgi:hypothetical protein
MNLCGRGLIITYTSQPAARQTGELTLPQDNSMVTLVPDKNDKRAERNTILWEHDT